MKLTTKQIIVNLLQNRGGWIPLWEFCNKQTECGFLPVTARSRAQDLAREGKIEHRLGSKSDAMIAGKYSWYKTKEIEYENFNVLDSMGKPYKIIKIPKVEKQVKLQTNLF